MALKEEIALLDKRLKVVEDALLGKSVEETVSIGKLLNVKADTSLSIEDIQKAVCSYFVIDLSVLTGKLKRKEIVRPRHIGMYLAKKEGFSFCKIALAFNKLDHTTAFHGCRKIETDLIKDKGLKRTLVEINTLYNNAAGKSTERQN